MSIDKNSESYKIFNESGYLDFFEGEAYDQQVVEWLVARFDADDTETFEKAWAECQRADWMVEMAYIMGVDAITIIEALVVIAESLMDESMEEEVEAIEAMIAIREFVNPEAEGSRGDVLDAHDIMIASENPDGPVSTRGFVLRAIREMAACVCSISTPDVAVSRAVDAMVEKELPDGDADSLRSYLNHRDAAQRVFADVVREHIKAEDFFAAFQQNLKGGQP